MGTGQQRLPVLTVLHTMHVILMTGKGATTFFKLHLRFKVCCKVGTKSAKIKQMQEISADQTPSWDINPSYEYIL